MNIKHKNIFRAKQTVKRLMENIGEIRLHDDTDELCPPDMPLLSRSALFSLFFKTFFPHFSRKSKLLRCSQNSTVFNTVVII